MVEGPRVGLAARFAEALHAGDGAELAAVSEEFEQMGDLVAAVDAAAHAAIAYRARVYADRRWAARHERKRWLNNAGAPVPPRSVGLPSGRR